MRSGKQARAQEQEPWRITEARIVGCKLSWFRSLEDASTYLVSFEYSTETGFFHGSMMAYYPRAIGETFPISYNPDDPRQNSAPDQPLRQGSLRWWVVLLFGILLALLLVHFGVE